MYLHRFSVFVWRGGNDSKTLRKDVYFLFFENGEEISVFKNLVSGFVWTGPYFDPKFNRQIIPSDCCLWIFLLTI